MSFADGMAGVNCTLQHSTHERQRVRRRGLAAQRGERGPSAEDAATNNSRSAGRQRAATLTPTAGASTAGARNEARTKEKPAEMAPQRARHKAARAQQDGSAQGRPRRRGQAMLYNIAYARGVASPAWASAPAPPAQSPDLWPCERLRPNAGISHVI